MSRYTPPRPRPARILYIGSPITESMSPELKEGIVRRRLLFSTGECPCGARLDTRRLPAGRQKMTVRHTDRCPAIG